MNYPNCPICDKEVIWCRHRVGDYEIIYVEKTFVMELIRSPHYYSIYHTVSGDPVLTLDGWVFLDEKRIEKLLLLK